MDTVEKSPKALSRLHFGVGINCGRGMRNVHSPVEKIITPIYSPPKRWIPAFRRCIPCIFFAKNTADTAFAAILGESPKCLSTNPQDVDKSPCG